MGGKKRIAAKWPKYKEVHAPNLAYDGRTLLLLSRTKNLLDGKSVN